MAGDGLDVSHAAIKKARDALAEVLEELAPGATKAAAVTTSAFSQGGAVSQLGWDPMAMGGGDEWSRDFQASFGRARTGIDSSFGEIVASLDAVVDRLHQAYQNYGNAEDAGAGPTRQV